MLKVPQNNEGLASHFRAFAAAPGTAVCLPGAAVRRGLHCRESCLLAASMLSDAPGLVRAKSSAATASCTLRSYLARRS
jgi:hypothetical protein